MNLFEQVQRTTGLQLLPLIEISCDLFQEVIRLAGAVLLEVHDDYVVISPNDPTDPDRRMRGTRESRPEVSAEQALG